MDTSISLTPEQAAGLAEISQGIRYDPALDLFRVRISYYSKHFPAYKDAIAYRDEALAKRAASMVRDGSSRSFPTVRHANTYYIGDTLRAARTRAGLSQMQLAQSFSKPHVMRSTIPEWEQNHLPVPARHLPTLSAALGVSIDDLLAGVEIDEVLDVEREPTLNAPSRFQPTIVPAKDNKK